MDEWYELENDFDQALELVAQLKQDFQGPEASEAPKDPDPQVPSSGLSRESIVFYMLIDTANTHPFIQRNRQILDQAQISYQLVNTQPQSLNLYAYQQTIIHKLQDAR